MPLQLAVEALGAALPWSSCTGCSARAAAGAAWRALPAQHRVFCVDLRNQERSPWTDSMRYAEMAAGVRALIQSDGLERPVVIGHSMGGKTAMTLALEALARSGDWSWSDVAPVSYADRLTSYVEAMQSINPHTTRMPDAGAVCFLLQNLVVRDDHFDWRLNLPAIGAAIPALCAFPRELGSRGFDAPALLLIAGSMSEYVSANDRAAFAELCPQTHPVEIDGAGHCVHADRPAELVAALELGARPRSVSNRRREWSFPVAARPG